MKGADPLIIAILMIVITVTAASLVSGWATALFHSQGQQLQNQTSTKLACQMASFYVRNVSISCNYNCFTGSPYSVNASVENTGSQSVSLSNVVATLSNGISHVLYGTPTALSAGATSNEAFNAIQIWSSPRMPVGTMDTRAAYFNDTNTTMLYHLDEGGTVSIADVSRNVTGYVYNGMDGALVNGVAWNTTGKYGGGLSFNGINNFVNVSNSNSLNLTSAFTIEAWVYPLGQNQDGGTLIVAKHNSTVDTGYLVALYQGKGLLQFGDGAIAPWPYSGNVQSTSLVRNNTWTHIAVTRSGTQAIWYINGIQDSVTTIGGNDTVNNNRDMWIGKDVNTPTNTATLFNGTMDELQIWNNSLTGAQINQTMNSANPNNLSFENDLVAYYPFSEGTGAVTHSEEFWAPGRFGSGIKFDGVKDYAVANASLISNDTGAIEAWINMANNAPSNDYGILDTPSEVSSNDSGLVGLWHFSENSTAANGVKDSSPYGNNATIMGTPTAMFTNNGRFGTGWIFNGTNYLNITASSSLRITTAVSVALWVNVRNYSNYPIIKEYSNGNGDYWVTVGTKWNCAAAGGGPGQAATNATVVLGQWTHVVLTFKSNDLKCYVNGVLSGAVSTTQSAPQGTTAPILIGGGYPSTISGIPSSFFNGTIDEVAIYNRILTPQEIAAMYAGSISLHKLGENVTFVAGNVTVGYNASALSGWQHVAGSYNSTTASLYVNDVLAGAVSRQKAVPMASRLYIGGFNGSASFNGTIDEVRISSFNRTFNVTLNINVSYPNIRYVRLFNATGLVNQSTDQSGASSYYTKYDNQKSNTEFRVEVEDTSGLVISKWYPYVQGGMCMPVSSIDRVRFAADNCPGVTDSYYGSDVYYEQCVM